MLFRSVLCRAHGIRRQARPRSRVRWESTAAPRRPRRSDARASLTYLSTLAVLQLDAILQNAKLQFVDKPKPGNKHQAKFEKMLGMQYSSPGIGDVRLMVGVRKRDKTKIQYCITSLIPVSRMKKEQP